MAANVAKYGFRLFRGAFSVANPPPFVPVRVASNYDSTTPVGTAGVGFHVGDPVNLLTDGTVQHLVVSDTTPTETTMKCLGIVAGIAPMFDSTIGQAGAMRPVNFLPTGIIYGTNFERQSYLFIIPAEGNVFEVDATGTVPTTQAGWQALIGANVPLIYSAVAPNAFPRIDVTTPVTTAEQVRIVDISPSIENADVTGANFKLLVQFNLVQQAPINTTGI